jgi:glycosyltransferase involved in cell wall biosynthesis
MIRILYIGAGTPWAGGAGYLLRQNLFLRALAEVAELHLAMFTADGKSPAPFKCDFTPIPTPGRNHASKMKFLIDDLLSSEPRMIRGYDLRESRRTVEALQPGKFDAVFAFRIDFAHFAGVLGQARLILDIDDPEHIRWRRRIAATTGKEGDWRTRRDIEKLKRFEHTAAAGAKISIVCQEADRQGWPTTPIVVPNCVEIVENPVRKPTRPRLLFVGNFAGGDNSPNGDAVLFFLREIWPAVLKAVPEAEFQIVGRTSSTVQQFAAGKSNILLSGFVDDLADIYAQATAAVAPIRFGTGTRIKILEAFAHGCPVVSTPIGAEGIDAVDGTEIALADGAEAFADRCVELLTNVELAQKLGHGGYDLAVRRYDRRVEHQRIVQILRKFFAETGCA